VRTGATKCRPPFTDLVIAYRTAFYPLHPSPLAPDPLQTYHALHPHPALSPAPTSDSPTATYEQAQNETAYRRLLAQGVLAVLLPTEDLENGCLRSLVGEVIAELIIGNGLGGKACESWMIWEGIISAVEAVHEKLTVHPPSDRQAGHRSESRKAPGTKHPDDHKSAHDAISPVAQSPSYLSIIFWRILQYLFLAFLTFRFLAITIITTYTSPPPPTKYSGASSPTSQSPLSPTSPRAGSVSAKKPILSMKIWTCISRLLSLQSRMPWLQGSLELVHYCLIHGPGRLGKPGGIIDRCVVLISICFPVQPFLVSRPACIHLRSSDHSVPLLLSIFSFVGL